jgi:hypothetical protein
MQTIGDLIERLIDISVEHFNGASYSRDIIRTKLLKVENINKYYYRVLAPVKEKKVGKKELLPTLTNAEYNILVIVAESHNVHVNELVSLSRKREVVDARMQAMVIFYVYLFYTFRRTASLFLRDHSTAIHAIETSNDLLETNEGFARSFVKTINNVKEKVPHLFESYEKLNEQFKQTYAKRKSVNGIREHNKKSFIREIVEQKEQIKKLLENE